MPKKPSKVTTTRHKLPLPANHPLKAKPKKRKPVKRDLFDLDARDLAYAKKHKLGIYAPPTIDVPARAIPCGEDTPMGAGCECGLTSAYQKAEPCTMWHISPETIKRFGTEPRITRTDEQIPQTPPDTSSYPWPLKFAWRVDGWMVRARVWLAERLLDASEWVTPK